jgi:hypothetical protein
LVGVAVKVTEVPEQTGFAEATIDTLTGRIALTVKLIPLSVPVLTGLLLITRIRYPFPEAVPPGIVAVMVPAVVDVNVPIFTGEEKLPVELDNCAVNTFPEV